MALFPVDPPPQLVWFQVYVAPSTDGANGKERFTTKLTTTTAATAALKVPNENHRAFLRFLSYASYILVLSFPYPNLSFPCKRESRLDPRFRGDDRKEGGDDRKEGRDGRKEAEDSRGDITS